MAFLPQDLYLASGTGQLINNWVDPVYKFDSSAFYNWEQDNLPIYDLEDRDNFLYEMAGYPASSVDGLMLTVSDCGIDNKKVFGTVSAAIDALPNTLRFPVIIEVCTSGSLGDLRLESKEFEGSGAGIEIINRGFAKVLCGSSTSPSSAVSGVNANASAILTFSSADASNTMTDSKSLGLGVVVGSKNPDKTSWWNKYTRAFVLNPEWGVVGENAGKTVTISSRFNDTAGTLLSTGAANANQFNVNIYEDSSVSSDTVVLNNGIAQQRAGIVAPLSTKRTIGFVYANSLSNVSVKDCAGKVYIRGFCVDGASQANITAAGSQTTKVGFDITNSEVVIENCTAARCTDAGMQLNNSNVILSRGFIAFHNYELETNPNFLDSKVTTNPTAGLRAYNSNVTLSASTENGKGLPADSPFCFYRNLIGIDLNNSNIITPPNTRKGTNMAGDSLAQVDGSETIVLQTFFNVQEGIRAKESLIDTSHRIASFQNKIGILLENSVCKVSQVTVDNNAEGGLVAKGSIFNYNKNATATGYEAGPFYPVTNFEANGQHVLLDSSEFVPTYVSGMDSVYERLSFSGNHQVESRVEGATTTKQTLPAVVVDNGSYMNAVGCKYLNLDVADELATAYQATGAIKGAAFRVTNNSNLDMFGHKNDNTIILGPQKWSKQQKIAGVYAGTGSHVYVAGPTFIGQFGVDALAEDGSTIEFGPHHKDGIIDASGWNLGDTGNHTKVDLHATRACLVANRNSVLDIHDMGDYHQHWDSKYLTNKDYPTGTGGYALSSLCASGYLQFYPNPFVNYTSYNLVNQAKFPSTAGAALVVTSARTVPATANPLKEIGLPAADSVSGLSYGGMCVRAVGDSQVNVKNVTFPVGWQNTSGAYYDFSTVGHCELLRIWNIADNSELHASYLSTGNSTLNALGTTHPQDLSSIYYGPSACWVSGAAWTPLSGAPSSTPNTSSLSVLDTFGQGVNHGGGLGYYGRTTFQNVGPFRIYVSPHPKAKFLGHPKTAAGHFYMPPQNPTAFNSMGYNFPSDATLIKGTPYQLFAQGYSTSSDCSATPPASVSAIYQDLGFSGYIETLPADQQVQNVASSFYYTSAMLPCDSEARIWLDESAMNTFANAKNGTLGTSGRKKIFSYYESTTDYPGEGFYAADATHGIGLGSANLFDLDRDL
jgi:hypothetical protein